MTGKIWVNGSLWSLTRSWPGHIGKLVDVLTSFIRGGSYSIFAVMNAPPFSCRTAFISLRSSWSSHKATCPLLFLTSLDPWITNTAVMHINKFKTFAVDLSLFLAKGAAHQTWGRSGNRVVNMRCVYTHEISIRLARGNTPEIFMQFVIYRYWFKNSQIF